jgi:hypothetical protein
MGIWAIINNDVVENTIVAESKEIAELVTGKSALEITSDFQVGINWFLENGTWFPPNQN